MLEETQADCMAGVALATAVNNGTLVMDTGDDAELKATMERIGDYENSHGTPQQRYDAYQNGFNTADIETCLGNRQ